MTGDAVDCPICGPRTARPWAREGGWQVVQCSGCGLLVTWPRPEPTASAALYGGSYYEERGMGAAASRAWDDRARELLARLPRRVRTALDFGAGEGHLVAALRRLGVDAGGIEASATGRDAARELHGLDLHRDASSLAPGSYDLVTAVHVLEHVTEPLGTLRALGELMGAEGVLFIEVPHAGSVEMWRPQRRREILDLPAHLYHFTPQTLAALVRQAGLRVGQTRLTNPEALEWTLGLRARWLSRREPATGTEAARSEAAPSARPSLWARSLLPWLRRRAPGWKFQILAHREDG